MKALLLLAALVCSTWAAEPPPGVVIHHSPASQRLYIGSPSLCVLPDGSYLASHDLFGPASKEHDLARGRLYRSTDKGASWQHVRDFEGFFWTGLFTRGKSVYTLGTDKHHGRVIARRSDDGGTEWREAVLAEGAWHTAPMPVIEHGGRIWRAIEDADGGTKWGERYRARMMSAPADADLLDPKSWTFSNPMARDATWLGGDFTAWLEGNAVVDPEGNMVDLLRVDQSHVPEKAAIVRISEDGTSASFDPAKDFIEMPGGAKKFTIRKDPAGPGYWTLASIIPERHAGAGRPASIRNTLALVFSDDLRNWEIRSILLYHPDLAKHGFQYVDWQFDGSDLIAACRTAWDDDEGGARNHHDANFLTFHRWQNFRKLTRKDDAPMSEAAGLTRETVDFSLKGGGFDIAELRNGAVAFSNRAYVWDAVPPSLAGSSFTRLGGGEKASLSVTARRDATVRIATSFGGNAANLSGWEKENEEFGYNDSGNTRVQVLSRPLKKGELLVLPRGNWTGSILILPKE
ncbi:exo-alpha-sialidase [Luteolibacter sp. Populi]|uniref:exo-alpha-sialidase n=1 Tax=Luteolibacter sp. Populi TaxID=3230487 RepID=UPI003466DBB7